MASTRAQQGSLIGNAAANGFRDQVIGSLMAMAIVVLFEGAAVADHANRLAYARAIIQSPQTLADQILPGYLQSAAIVASAGTPSAIADIAVDAQTQNIFNFYADLYVSQLNFGPGLQIGA